MEIDSEVIEKTISDLRDIAKTNPEKALDIDVVEGIIRAEFKPKKESRITTNILHEKTHNGNTGFQVHESGNVFVDVHKVAKTYDVTKRVLEDFNGNPFTIRTLRLEQEDGKLVDLNWFD